MAYIGRQLTSGNYLKLDDISSQFNGTTTTFNLTSGGTAFYPGSAYSLLVSLGGVIQEPVTSYNINQNQIIFTAAPAAIVDFFCIVMGVSLGIGVPGEGTVSGSKLSNPFNYDSGLLYLDGTNDRVGIGTNNPVAKLDVFQGTAYIGGTSGDAYFVTYADVSGSNVSIEAINRENTIKRNLTLNAYGGNVGIGITNPGCSLQINGGVRARGGAPGAGGANNNGYAFSGGSGDNDSGMFSSADGQLEFYVNSQEALRITTGRALYVTQTPGSYTIDTTAGATSIANNGTVDFPNASGMLVVNNHTNGGVTIYLCGGGSTVVVSNVIAQVGTFTFIAGIGGYRWTNNYGSTATFGFFFVRTRTYS